MANRIRSKRETTCSHMTRSSSIDSMIEAVWAENGSPTKRGSLLAPPRFSEQHRPSLALVSPSVGRRMKGQRGINGKSSIRIIFHTDISSEFVHELTRNSNFPSTLLKLGTM
ncbi:hypothetical protein CBL_14476 [Carabus blaptoides fortunei]